MSYRSLRSISPIRSSIIRSNGPTIDGSAMNEESPGIHVGRPCRGMVLFPITPHSGGRFFSMGIPTDWSGHQACATLHFEGLMAFITGSGIRKEIAESTRSPNCFGSMNNRLVEIVIWSLA